MNGDDNEGAGLSTDLSKLPLWLRNVTCPARTPECGCRTATEGFLLLTTIPDGLNQSSVPSSLGKAMAENFSAMVLQCPVL
jgi:hypothetical protein